MKPEHIFRIAHFSDVHIGLKDFHFGYLFDKRLFGRMNQLLRRQSRLSLENIPKFARLLKSFEADLTVCTGDLASIGSDAEFDHAREALAPVIDAANGNFVFVPGNHDAYIPANAPALKRVFAILNRKRWKLDALPQTMRVGPVEIIAVNGARPCRIWQSTGELSANAWGKLDYILSHRLNGVKARFLVGHFPLFDDKGAPLNWRTKLLGGERLLRAADERRFDAFLSGHVHRPFVKPIGNAGALGIGAGSLTICGSCALVEIDKNTGKISAAIHNLNDVP